MTNFDHERLSLMAYILGISALILAYLFFFIYLSTDILVLGILALILSGIIFPCFILGGILIYVFDELKTIKQSEKEKKLAKPSVDDNGCEYCQGRTPLIATDDLYISHRKILIGDETIYLAFCPRCGKRLV